MLTGTRSKIRLVHSGKIGLLGPIFHRRHLYSKMPFYFDEPHHPAIGHLDRLAFCECHPAMAMTPQVRVAIIGTGALVLAVAFTAGVVLARRMSPSAVIIAQRIEQNAFQAASAVTPVHVEPQIARRPFETMWLDAGLAIKAERLARPVVRPEAVKPEPEAPTHATPTQVVPTYVAPLRVAPLKQAEPVDVAQSEEDRRKSAKRKTVTVQYDVCRGRGKVYVKGGKRWHCKR